MLDMHMHSTASDGTDTPEQIITKCVKLNLQLSAITDHDTVEAQSAAAKLAKEKKINYITGVELSVTHTGELHVLGYGVDVFCPSFQKTMSTLTQARIQRVYAILDELKKHNINIPFEEIKENAMGNTLGRPHIALSLVKRGYAENIRHAFNKYLNEDAICYVQRQKLKSSQAIELILNAKGIPVLAHPKLIQTDNMDMLVKQLTDAGLQGIEAYYPSHTDIDVQKFREIAHKNGLLVSLGSDYHGTMRKNCAIACEKRTSEQLEQSVAVFIKKSKENFQNI